MFVRTAAIASLLVLSAAAAAQAAPSPQAGSQPSPYGHYENMTPARADAGRKGIAPEPFQAKRHKPAVVSQHIAPEPFRGKRPHQATGEQAIAPEPFQGR